MRRAPLALGVAVASIAVASPAADATCEGPDASSTAVRTSTRPAA